MLPCSPACGCFVCDPMHGDGEALGRSTRSGAAALIRHGFAACARCAAVAEQVRADVALALFRSVCLGCGRVYDVAARARCGRDGGPVDTSHGICPSCDRLAELEQAARDLVAAHARVGGVSVHALAQTLVELDAARRAFATLPSTPTRDPATRRTLRSQARW